MCLPQDRYYTLSHQWVKLDQGKARLGITYYGQMQLGQIIFIELPAPDTKIAASQVIATIESSKVAAEVHSPLSGKVVEVNQKLSKTPGLINSSPYDQGWVCVLALDSPDEAKELLDAAAYQSLLEGISGKDIG
jgi:glycine cleavage system H protein